MSTRMTQPMAIERFARAAKAKRMHVRRFGIAALLLIRDLQARPLPMQTRTAPGERSPATLGALVSLGGVRFNPESRHYEITQTGEQVLKIYRRAGLLSLAEELQARVKSSQKEVGA